MSKNSSFNILNDLAKNILIGFCFTYFIIVISSIAQLSIPLIAGGEASEESLFDDLNINLSDDNSPTNRELKKDKEFSISKDNLLEDTATPLSNFTKSPTPSYHDTPFSDNQDMYDLDTRNNNNNTGGATGNINNPSPYNLGLDGVGDSTPFVDKNTNGK